MKPKNLLLILFLFAYTSFHAQELKIQKPNYKKISKLTHKKDSEFYYPTLFRRFLKGDSSLSLKEKQYLYYGFSFQKIYTPYGESRYKDTIRTLVRKKERTAIEKQKLIDQCNSHLEKFPFDIKIMRIQAYAYKSSRKMTEFRQVLHKIRIVNQAILSSGTGKTKSNAYHVIYISHEYDILKALRYQQKGSRSMLKKKYEYLEVKPNKDNVKGIYFNLIQGMKSINE